MGCIRFVSINDNIIDLSQPENGIGLSQCEDNSACNLNHQCANGATCIEDANTQRGYSCICPQGYSGKSSFITLINIPVNCLYLNKLFLKQVTSLHEDYSGMSLFL